MPKRKKVLATTRVVTAGKKRKCYFSASHEIAKGDKCLEVKAGLPFKGYCVACARNMLADAERGIEELRRLLG